MGNHVHKLLKVNSVVVVKLDLSNPCHLSTFKHKHIRIIANTITEAIQEQFPQYPDLQRDAEAVVKTFTTADATI